MVINVAFLKRFENGRVMYFRKMHDGGSRASDDLVSSQYDKVPDKGTKILPRGIQNVKTLLTTTMQVKVLVKGACNIQYDEPWPKEDQ